MKTAARENPPGVHAMGGDRFCADKNEASRPWVS